LKDTDPEFYNYLQENDASLLDFEGEDDDSEMEEVALEADDEYVTNTKSMPAKKQLYKEVNEELLFDTVEKMKAGSLKDLQKLLGMFKSACQPYHDELDDDSSDDEHANNNKVIYSIASPEIYQKVMTICIDSLHEGFRKQLELSFPYKKSEVTLIVEHSKWKKISFCLRSFFQMQFQNLQALESQVQHRQVLYFFLSSLENYIPLLHALPKLQKRLYKLLINLWAGFMHGLEDAEADGDENSGDAGENDIKYEVIRGECVLRLLQMIRVLPDSIAEEIFRKLYLTFARVVNKPVSEQNAVVVAYLTSSLSEMFQLDVSVAYQQAFLYIRQLALHLRSGFLKKGVESVKSLKSWQFLNCCRLWTRVIVTSVHNARENKRDNMNEDIGLSMLAFPLSQILHGLLKLLPSPYFVPLRFHIVSCLQQLAAQCQLFLPTATILLEVLRFPELFSTKVAAGTEIPVPLQYAMSLPPNSLQKMNVKDVIVLETLTLLNKEIEIYRNQYGYLEYVLPVIKQLKSFAKLCREKKMFRNWAGLSKSLIEVIAERVDEVKSIPHPFLYGTRSNSQPLLPTSSALVNLKRNSSEARPKIIIQSDKEKEEDLKDESSADEEGDISDVGEVDSDKGGELLETLRDEVTDLNSFFDW